MYALTQDRDGVWRLPKREKKKPTSEKAGKKKINKGFRILHTAENVVYNAYKSAKYAALSTGIVAVADMLLKALQTGGKDITSLSESAVSAAAWGAFCYAAIPGIAYSFVAGRMTEEKAYAEYKAQQEQRKSNPNIIPGTPVRDKFYRNGRRLCIAASCAGLSMFVYNAKNHMSPFSENDTSPKKEIKTSATTKQQPQNALAFQMQ